MHFIFDLDHTLIDSSHRKIARPDGSLDLDHWIENSTPEKVAADSLLPLVSYYRKLWARGHIMIICTARVMSEADYRYLRDNDIRFHFILSRPQGCTMADHELKDVQLRMFAHDRGISWKTFAASAYLFDDNPAILERGKDMGITVFDALQLNKVAA